jgi:phage terminase large subunit-like protein
VASARSGGVAAPPAPPPKRPRHPAKAYLADVLAGKVVVGKWVRLQVERHARDLARAGTKAFPYVFDEAAAQRVIDFFGFLHHSKGEWGGQAFVLEPWQQAHCWILFGWVHAETGLRRFRTAYDEIARKNGKSTLAAGIGLYLFFADAEPGAEVYTAATKRDQARIVHGEAVRMVQASAALRARIGVVKDNLHVLATHSKFEPLGADSDTMDGLNIHGAVVDEVHAHKTRGVVDVLETATGARRQSLIFYITTAGYNRLSVCWELRDYSTKVLDGVVDDETWFAWVCAIDEGDDWQDERVWGKANPNLGVSVKLDDLRRKAKKARELPGAQNAFRRLHLNEWTEQADRWLDLELWDRNTGRAYTLADLAGRACLGGLDLASTTDVCALELLFPPEEDADEDEDVYAVLSFFWAPKDTIRERTRKDRVPYDVWHRDGFLLGTEGNVVDYDAIREHLRELAEVVEIRELAYDRWNASQLVTDLQGDGFTCVPIGQGFASMTAPTRELEKLLLSGRIAHGGHPVLRWMATNVAVEQDAAGNLKPSKKKSTEKIDGIVALVMAIARAIVPNADDDTLDDADVRFFG